MRVNGADYSLPAELVAHMEYMRHHKQEQLVMKPLPTLPIVIQSDFFVYEFKVGPVMKVQMSPNLGRLLAIA